MLHVLPVVLPLLVVVTDLLDDLLQSRLDMLALHVLLHDLQLCADEALVLALEGHTAAAVVLDHQRLRLYCARQVRERPVLVV